MKRSGIHFFLAALLVTGLLFPAAAMSEDKPLVIAFRGDAATLDPHGRNETTTQTIQLHFYDRLVKMDPDLKIVPDLAESWRLIDNVTWEFKLKKGVTFHNGEPFNAEAAKYSLIRARTWKKSQWKHMVPDYSEIKVVDDYTIHVITKAPEPESLLMLTSIAMVPPKYFSETDEAELAVHPIGTGPYKFIEWVKDDHVKMVANENWHGGKFDFKDVVIRPIPEDATRVAALITGEVDVIWGVSIPDIPRIEKNEDTYVSRVPSQRAIYIMFDVHSDEGGPAPEKQPGLPEGKPNPFKNQKVREAVAHAIDVDEIIKYVMEGSAYPASQIISPYAPDFNPDIKRPEFDLEKAKALLKEAGFGDGFEANFDCPNDRYINDQLVTEAIAQQLTKIGLKLNVIATPKAVFFPKMDKFESPMFLAGWGTLSYQSTMNNFFRENKAPYGRNNRGRFYNPEIDKRLDVANSEMDPAKRFELRKAVAADVYATYYVIPLYYQENVIGFNKRVDSKARVDEYLFAFDMKKAK